MNTVRAITCRGCGSQAAIGVLVQLPPVLVLAVQEVDGEADHVRRRRPAAGRGVHGDERGHVHRQDQPEVGVSERPGGAIAAGSATSG